MIIDNKVKVALTKQRKKIREWLRKTEGKYFLIEDFDKEFGE